MKQILTVLFLSIAFLPACATMDRKPDHAMSVESPHAMDAMATPAMIGPMVHMFQKDGIAVSIHAIDFSRHMALMGSGHYHDKHMTTVGKMRHDALLDCTTMTGENRKNCIALMRKLGHNQPKMQCSVLDRELMLECLSIMKEGAHGDMKVGGTHHLLANVASISGKKVEKATVRFRIRTPDHSLLHPAVKDIHGIHTATFSHPKPGKLEIHITVDADGKKIEDRFILAVP